MSFLRSRFLDLIISLPELVLFVQTTLKLPGRLTGSFLSHLHLYTITIFTDGSWHSGSNASGLGFLIIDSYGKIFLAGSMGVVYSSPISAKMDAIFQALEVCKEQGWNPPRIRCDYPRISNLIKKHHPCIAWRINLEIHKLKSILKSFLHTSFITIPREENNIADELALHGRLNQQLSLFFRGLDRPSWPEDLCYIRNLFL